MASDPLTSESATPGPGSAHRDADAGARRSTLPFPVVGIGASAGGMSAVLRLLEQLPGRTGMAFVVVLHLSPEHESNAPAIFQRATSMPVQAVTEDVEVAPDRVYVIAPALSLSMDDGRLRVQPLDWPRARPVAIDRFFRTLAKAHRERAIAIVLSGTGSDGAVGLADMKAEGGIVFAQDPADAEYDGMPNAAIATRLVDFVLPAAEIPEKLQTVWQNARSIELPDAAQLDLPVAQAPSPEGVARGEGAMRAVMEMLRARTGHDFHHYKRATILRRLERRLQVTGQRTLDDYRGFLETHLEETEPLLQDMLISVTSFFRDRDAFEALERELMRMLDRKPPPSRLRAWSAGCATGEEAFSLAMIINDHLPAGGATSVQVFGSDIDERSLAIARHGVYPNAIAADVPPVRLRQYFHQEESHHRIRKSLREQIMFARHNVLQDPPFSQLDLLSCRNLLIYLDRESQTEVLETFHFALKPGGLLFLGSAETADWLPHLFSPVDKKHRIYRAEAGVHSRHDLPALRGAHLSVLGPAAIGAAPDAAHASTLRVYERMVEEASPPSVLIDRQCNVVRVGGGASRYLQVRDGAISRDLLEIILPTLAAPLRVAMLHAMQSQTRVVCAPLPLPGDAGTGAQVRMTVRPALSSGDAGWFLVVFDEFDCDLSIPSGAPVPVRDPALEVLEGELRRLYAQMEGTLDASASSSEALRASNEELQSINEELHSATEELETSKEELQSVNEELTTVNFELKRKVDEAAKVNDDLTNLIVSMDIATVFVDRALRIKRFTPKMSEIFNVLPTDVGRPLSDLTHRLDYERLEDDVVQVLSRLQMVEREVSAHDRRWFLVRISPYRLGEDRIDGAVVNLIDITERRNTQDQLRAREQRLRLVAENTQDYAIITMDPHGQVTSWNKGAELMFGYTEDEMRGAHFDRLFVAEDRAAGIPAAELRTAYERGRALDERWHQRRDGSRFYCSGITTRIDDQSEHGFAKIARDQTDRQQMETQLESLLQAEQQLRSQLESAQTLRSEFLAIMSHELKNPLNLILLNAELMARAPQVQAVPGLVRAADIIRRTVHGQAQIIDDLLDLSRLSTGKLALYLAPVDVRLIIERIVATVTPEAVARSIGLRAEVPSVMVLADAVRLEQILWNLVSNALKFTPDGGRIEITAERTHDAASITVRDTGRGIEPQMIDKIFALFEQGQRQPTRRRDSGMGIGLTLVKQLAELHGGRVEAHSDGAGTGARFTVTLPLFTGQVSETASSVKTQMMGLRVLLIDDDVEALEALEALLTAEGARPSTAASAQDALRLAAAHDFDLVISDIAMPDKDGYDLMRELRRMPRCAAWPSIALTGFARAVDIERAMAAGFDIHLSKPLSIAALTESLQKLFSTRL